ncbi:MULTISPECIES: MarR family winged helix-turn-helix transcriptional regulator [Bacillaceae]|uniref:MarR family transcriptional regulator n=1 Tax=Lentibacillus amyloliquefaciens TaxID=1472767 RepID=A0A0U3WI01_9BACI|nr:MULTISPECIES: MarR family transcriptional regulator [Bacillaceae]ALX49503.1 MarR family transcriptional regulator [Lentibacillus amyloliquefaciens]
MNKNEAMKLSNQLCFSIYSLSREINKMYRPLLGELNLTYTQYLALLVLWEKETCTVKEIGEVLYLDSGTLTPVLKRMAERNLVNRKRDSKDERKVLISLTEEGWELRNHAKEIPSELINKSGLTQEEFTKTLSDFTTLLKQIQQENSK